ncbi:VCBS repeat-containing protein [Streptomyces sp. NBC_00233]|uniref:VCBS repeat-containing protein n=1 Tax=Streptomyces sp. NBC_00233 TaxID=2975686 RepID=UPI002256127E|nr:VCBS repeat-containing protein [Streptomyces sp. NBC_00233]MCX5227855.1 VCBS repeat-containing protein [Streptomyces sp. NBC_00233]
MRFTLGRRRLAISVGVVLTAVTAASLTVPAASAASALTPAVPASASLTAASAQVPFLASGGKLLGAGTTGFLSQDHEGTARWTRYADGVSKVVAKSEGEYVVGSGAGSDLVLVASEVAPAGGEEIYTSTVKVYDMATGAAPVTLDLSASPETHGFLDGAVGSTLLVSDGGLKTLKLIDISGGKPTVRTVGTYYEPRWMSDTLPDTAVARNYDEDLVVDLKTGQQVGRYQLAPEPGWPKPYVARSSFLSATRVAWTERTDDKLVLATAVRGQSEVVRTPLGPDDSTEITGGLLGDWFLWGAVSGNDAPWHAFSARSLTDGSTVKLLDHATHATKGPDGTLLVLGVTAAHGAGVYRVSVGADGRPAADLIASTGEPNDGATPLTYVGGAPVAVNLDGVAKARLSWKFSTTRADLTVELESKVTGEKFRTVVRPASGTGAYPDGSLGLAWAGEVTGSDMEPEPAPNGAYEWTVTARPWNGMPSVTTTGTLTVVRAPKAHDYDHNGAPDLIARDKGGYLHQLGTRWDDATGRLVGTWNGFSGMRGWNIYDRIESVGDVAGANSADLVARDRTGVLWLHRGRPADSPYSSGFESRLRIGGGWNTYTQLTGGSDLTGDGRADLVGLDKAGDLYLHTATGSPDAPYAAARKKIGYGWGIYNQITATGNIGGAAAGDLVARDKDGVLWTYLGKGDGTFAARTRIGGGWNAYADIVGIGDGNKDGRPDVYARTPAGTAFLHPGTGDYKVPFAPRASTQVGTGQSEMGQPYDQVS